MQRGETVLARNLDRSSIDGEVIDALDLELSPSELRYLDLQTDDFHNQA